jgi:hypothetical protein
MDGKRVMRLEMEDGPDYGEILSAKERKIGLYPTHKTILFTHLISKNT